MAPAVLENIPTETVQQIASFFSHKDTRNLSLTCRSLRSKLYRLSWSRVLIHGGEHDLVSKLAIFDPESEDGRATLALVEKATVIKNLEHPYYHGDPWDELSYHLQPTYNFSISRVIMQTLQAMTSVKSLHLNVLGFSAQQENAMIDLLKKSPDFQLRHLTIRAREYNAKYFLQRCSPDELRSLDTDQWWTGGSLTFTSDKLERVRIHFHSNGHSYEPYRDHDFVVQTNFELTLPNTISDCFPNLKTLIIHESRNTIHLCTIQVFTGAFDTAHILEARYPCLERLAFNFIWLQCWPEEYGDVFFEDLAERIAGDHPALEEICVLAEPPCFYQWKRGQGITVRSFHEMPNPHGFPFGVEE